MGRYVLSCRQIRRNIDMLEILSPAGSPEAVVAAVQNGADAVYLGFGDFNARRNAKNFTEEEFRSAAEYCRIRGVKVYVTLNTLLSDREIPAALETARTAVRYGADALIVQDIGLIQALRHALPGTELHGSTQMSVHSLEGVKMCAAMGLSRVCLARELDGDEIAEICRLSPIELEVFGHGALCMCYSGQCYMSSVIGRRSGNRGLCAQPCRQPYDTGAHSSQYPLSLKDNCLIHWLDELESMGVTCLKLEGRMRRPEYSAIVTGIYSRAVREHALPSEETLRLLRSAFSRQGFTDGYYTGRKGPDMFGVRTEEDKSETVVYSTARKNYLNGEYQRVPVRFVARIREGRPAELAAADDRGHTAVTIGQKPEKAFHRELTDVQLQTQLHKTGGTPFVCMGVKSQIDSGLSMAVASINEMRRAVLVDLLQQRRELPAVEEGTFTPTPSVPNRRDHAVITLSFLKASQISPEIADLKPAAVYLPAEEYSESSGILSLLAEDPDIRLGVILPRIMHDREREECSRLLEHARAIGASEALVGNIGHLLFAREHGLALRGDYGLNIFNSESLMVLKELGLSSATLSFELRLQQIRDISKCIDTEIIAYGRLPLMITENCIVKNAYGVCRCDSFSGIRDKTGASFPVVRAFGCRNEILNSQKLFLADRLADVDAAGIAAARLCFTTENPAECVGVVRRYMGLEASDPAGFTRGLYYRGVE